MFEKAMERLRVSAYFLIAFFIWAIWSIEPFFANRPQDFQAAGSIIVAWAIFFYGRNRLIREDAIHASNKQLFVASHNFLITHLELHQSKADNTANMNSLSYARLLKMFGLKDREMGDTDEAIEALKRSVDNLEKHTQLVENARAADAALTDSIEFNQKTEGAETTWAKIIYRVELGLVIFGTLQWGYGDRWVNSFHKNLPQLESWWRTQW